MMSPLRLAITLVQIWTRVYTWRMDPEARDRRRAEIESDLFESQQDSAQLGSDRPAAHVLIRLLAGAVDDIGWRVEETAASATPFARAGVVAAIAAIAASLAWWGLGLSERRPTSAPTVKVFMGAPYPPPPPPPRSGIERSQRRHRNQP